ncbi:MAG: hypothetical protein IKT06_01860 [Aeriscardovia sp.]|nr:hypothetical protein [Aeriscardovia sp.]
MEAADKVRSMLGRIPEFSCPLLISGGSPASRLECAKSLCSLLEEKDAPLNSPDILFIAQTPPPSISQVREAVDLMQKFPASLPRRVGIVENISSLSEAAQDALLKDLEEGAKRSSWILFSPSLLGVAPAVKSRSHCYFISPSFGAEKQEEAPARELLSSLLALPSMSGALRLASAVAGKAKEAEDKKLFCSSILSSLLSVFSQAIMEKDGLPQASPLASALCSLPRQSLLFLIEEVKASFDKVASNLSPQLIFESLFCQILLRWRF